MTPDCPELPGVLLTLGLDDDPIGPALLVVEDLAATASVLQAQGWLHKDVRWAKFAAGTAQRLDVIGAHQLGVNIRDGRTMAERPLLDAELRIRAVATPTATGAVPARYRAAMHRRIARDPGAWLRAHALAGHDADRVRLLQDAYENGLPPHPNMAAEVVALSGLDGAGKSTQAHLLAVALHALGQDAAVEWARLGYAASLDRWAAPVKRLLSLRRPGPERPATSAAVELGAKRPVTRPVLLDAVWAGVVAAAEVADARRRQGPHAAAGRVVVSDRYLLDALVHLSDRYGGPLASAPGRRLLRQWLPAASVPLLLELPPDVAFARKPGEWSLEDLTRHAAAYAVEADRNGVARLDATLAPHVLAAQIGSRVWAALP